MDRIAVSEQVNRILRSRTFANKGQLRKLLEVLQRNLNSDAPLKPDQVIRELWPDEIRTKRSADVATEVNRLRHALDSYYDEEGANDAITIYLPNRSVSAGNGSHPTRWIAARSRESAEPDPADQTVTSAIPRSGRTLKIAIGIVIIVVTAIAGYLLLRVFSLHAQPQFGRLDGPVLRIMDANGKELWSKSFPEGLGPDWYYGPVWGKRLWFADLEGKGETSVLFSYSPATPQPHSTTLICYSSRGKEKWRWTPGRELPELEGSPATYNTMALAILKPTKTRAARIVVTSPHAVWWPTQLAILDAAGHVVSEYWHSGALTHLILADLDGNGKEEIIATGASEYDHQATLVVIDPDQAGGASTEDRPAFQIHGMGTAHERLRLLFPRSDLNRALYQYDEAIEPSFEHDSVRLTVIECISPPGCRLWYEFKKDFHLIAAYAGGDEFRSAHNQFFQAGKNAHTLTAEEQAAFQKVRCLVGCQSEFVPVGDLVP